ncbi:MAG TPA: gliding motility-associated protein GldE [Flavobacteriales bacterium]
MDSVPRLFTEIIFIQNIESSTLTLVIVLLLLSFLFSAAEAALFSLSRQQVQLLDDSNRPADRRLVHLLSTPDKETAGTRSFATAQLMSTLCNALVIIALLPYLHPLWEGFWTERFLPLAALVLGFIIITEVVPKTIAYRYNLALARFMALPMSLCSYLLFPVTWLLQRFSKSLEKAIKPNGSSPLSMDELSHALELTTDDNLTAEENKILEGIVTFGDKEAAQIMTSRVDVVFLYDTDSFEEVIATVTESGYSRLPVIHDSPDDVKGFLVVKDLLPYIGETDFQWQTLVKPPFFVPENKKIDDLLQEFRVSKTHMAIVVDEYGGTSGIITMEDILEEIVGDISDEFDDEDLQYSKLDNRNYVMEGKIPMVDFYKILDIDDTLFEEAKGDSSTLAGFIIEQAGKIPEKGDEISFEGYTFKIESADKRKIKRVKITLPA